MIVIGLAGAKGSGKDYAFNIIKNHFKDYHVKQIAFADPIRKVLFEVFNINKNQYDILKRTECVSLIDANTNKQITTANGRELVRGIGMALRNVDDQQFCRYVRDTIKSNDTHNTIWVVTDVRFENEVDLIHELNGYTVLIERPGYVFDNHVTERNLENYDFTITNSQDDVFDQAVITTTQAIINLSLT